MNERTRSSLPLWGALLASGAAWSVHLIAGHFLVEALCLPVASDPGAGARAGVWIPLVVLSALTALLCLGAGLWALGSRSLLRRGGPGLERAASLALVVALLAFFFAGLIVVETVPLTLLGCGGG